MEIPIDVPVGETTGYKNAEYTLEQKQEAVCDEQELKNAIDTSEYFFDTKDMNTTIHDILHPDSVYTKPLMKNIVSAALCITTRKEKKPILVQSTTWIKQKNNTQLPK